MSQRSAREIHLPQLLNEEAIADEFSNWEQVSSLAAERFPQTFPTPPAPPPSHPFLFSILPQVCEANPKTKNRKPQTPGLRLSHYLSAEKARAGGGGCCGLLAASFVPLQLITNFD